ncbi:MAG: helix-turn-helix domain-containing protein [Myxococcota bacterium]|nr:helix-turn-helix domain-containing protein [Myxococcota bacterium]
MTPPLNYREAARLLGIPVGTLRSMVCRRQVPHIRISPRVVVFDVIVLETWIAARRVGVANDDAGSVDRADRAA